MEFDGSMKGDSNGDYSMVCEKNGEKSVKALAVSGNGSKAIAPLEKDGKTALNKDEKKPSTKNPKKPAAKAPPKPAPAPQKDGKK